MTLFRIIDKKIFLLQLLYSKVLKSYEIVDVFTLKDYLDMKRRFRYDYLKGDNIHFLHL